MSSLRQKMIGAIQLREFSPKTQEAYVAVCKKTLFEIDLGIRMSFFANMNQISGRREL